MRTLDEARGNELGFPASRALTLAGATALAVSALLLGAAAGMLASRGTVVGLLVPVVLAPWLIWRQPAVGVYLLLAGAVLVEQSPYTVGPREGALTARIPLFQGLLPAGIQPADLLLLLTLVVAIMHSVRKREAWLRWSPLFAAMGLWFGVVSAHLLLGLVNGGDPTGALWEIRGFVFLVLSFLVASLVIRNERDLERLLWIIVLGSAFKAAYGIAIFYSVRYVEPRPEAVLGHEESFLLGVCVLMTAALWAFSVRGTLRVVATAFLPIIIMGNLVNSRRSAWLVLGVGLVSILIVAVRRIPRRRGTFLGFAAIAALAFTAYLPVFWSNDGLLAQPARAIRATVQPDERDQSSNEYRDIENLNLERLISESGGVGTGFGIPIEYQGLIDLTELAPILRFQPHNSVLHLWLRTGILGMAALVVLLSQALISALRTTESKSMRLAATGATVTSAIMAYGAMAVVDMGFHWLRIGLELGILLGAIHSVSASQMAK